MTPAGAGDCVVMFSLGGLVAGLPVLAWLGTQGALGLMWDQVVVYSSIYGAVACPIPGWYGWPCSDMYVGLKVVAILTVLGLAVAAFGGLSLRAVCTGRILALVILVGLVMVALPRCVE